MTADMRSHPKAEKNTENKVSAHVVTVMLCVLLTSVCAAHCLAPLANQLQPAVIQRKINDAKI